MFTDPLTLTVNAIAKTLPKVSTQPFQSGYQTNDEAYKLSISHQATKSATPRLRSMVRVDHTAVVVNPLTGDNENQSLSIYIVIDRPKSTAFSDTTVSHNVVALKDLLTLGNLTKIYGQES